MQRTAYSETLMPRFNFGWSELRSLRSEGLKVIEAPRPEVYDLEADPGELMNLHSHGEFRSTVVDLDSELADISGVDPFAQGENLPVAISDSTRDKLWRLSGTSRPTPRAP